MKSWFQFLAVLVLVVVAGLSPRDALAQSATGVTSTTKIINDIIRGTPGVTSRTITGAGVTATASGATAVTANGLTIPIPASASAGVSAGRIAGIMGKAVRFGSFIGMASLIAPWVMDEAGITVCPPPDFFCKPTPPEPQIPSSGGWVTSYVYSSPPKVFSGGTADHACAQLWKYVLTTLSPEQVKALAGESLFFRPGSPPTSGECAYKSRPYGSAYSVVSSSAATCPAGSVPTSDGRGCMAEKGGTTGASDSDIGGAVEGAMGKDPGKIGPAFDAVRGSGLPVFQAGDTVTVTVPPSVSAPPVVQTQTIPKADGSVDTVKTVTETVVQPKVTGSTMGDTTITYPTTTTTTTTTTNNITNQSTTTTTIINNYAQPVEAIPSAPGAPAPQPIPDGPSPQPEKTEFPTDYNREPTQQSILSVLRDAFSPIKEQVATGDEQIEQMKAENDKGMEQIAGITAETVNVPNWFPKVPTASCIDPQIPMPLTNSTISFPICGYVDTFSLFITGVICFFCVLGCVHQVQTAWRA